MAVFFGHSFSSASFRRATQRGVQRATQSGGRRQLGEVVRDSLQLLGEPVRGDDGGGGGVGGVHRLEAESDDGNLDLLQKAISKIGEG